MFLDRILEEARERGASDVHLLAGLAPTYRINGELMSTGPEIDAEAAWGLIEECLNDVQRTALRTRQQCVSMTSRERGRIRVTAYMRCGIPELAIRLSEQGIRLRGDLRLPEVIDDFCRKPNGLVLITGPTGVGKTTTLHYMVNLINSEMRKKIITLEDPIEYVHHMRQALVVQLEVPTDIKSFREGLRDVLRQDPDVIVIGEMRDRDTIYSTLVAAETGHLVIATLHTPNATLAVERMMTAFPEGQQGEIRTMLSNVLQGVIAQQLIPRADGKGRILAREVLIGTAAVKAHLRGNTLHKLFNEMQLGARFGMMTLDHDLLELYERGEITYDHAVTMARFPDSIRNRCA